MAPLLITDDDAFHDPTPAAGASDVCAPLTQDWLRLDLPAATKRLERALIEHTLTQTQGNRAEAARRLGIHRQLLYRKLAQYAIT